MRNVSRRRDPVPPGTPRASTGGAVPRRIFESSRPSHPPGHEAISRLRTRRRGSPPIRTRSRNREDRPWWALVNGESLDSRTSTGRVRRRAPSGACHYIKGFFDGLRLVDDVIDGGLLHFPFPGFPVEARQGEAMPIIIIQLHMIASIVIPRPPRFLAEQGVMGDGE